MQRCGLAHMAGSVRVLIRSLSEHIRMFEWHGGKDLALRDSTARQMPSKGVNKYNTFTFRVTDIFLSK